MNKARKDQVAKIREQLDKLMDQLRDLESEEQEAFDNMPEGVQGSERGEESQTWIDALGNAAGDVENAANTLDI